MNKTKYLWGFDVILKLNMFRSLGYDTRAYCLITLLEYMGKLLEKVVAYRLTYLTG